MCKADTLGFIKSGTVIGRDTRETNLEEIAVRPLPLLSSHLWMIEQVLIFLFLGAKIYGTIIIKIFYPA